MRGKGAVTALFPGTRFQHERDKEWSFMAKGRPLITIGIIFRDNVNSIERCLKALQPLRDAVPSELIMADTGSSDGSRETAERYADELFDFPWIDDFSAARNAVMDRAKGRWFFTVDTDEYLDPDISFLVNFLKVDEAGKYKTPPDLCTVLVRNYRNHELTGRYTDFMAMRLVRRSSGIRYEGAIHEAFNYRDATPAAAMPKVILHHDGYVDVEAKSKRNMPLLRRKLEENPDSLTVWMQLIESGLYEPDFRDFVTGAVERVERRTEGWEKVGPSIMSDAISFAFANDYPELWDWIRLAEESFPGSPYVEMDVQFYAALALYNNDKNYPESIRRGEKYLETVEQYHKGKIDYSLLCYSALRTESSYNEWFMRYTLVDSYLEEGRPDKAWEIANALDFGVLEDEQLKMAAQTIHWLHNRTDGDTAPMVNTFWNEFMNRSPESFRQLSDELTKYVLPLFTYETWENDLKLGRPRATAYLPLSGKFWAGDAAAIVLAETASEAEHLLETTKSHTVMPPMVFLHAWEVGVPFSPATLEQADAAAMGMSNESQKLTELTLMEDLFDLSVPNDACWARAFVLAALRTCKWDDREQGKALARRFAKVERSFLPLCYSDAVLKEENLFLLPSMHRFGWYCVRAYDALDGGDSAGFIHLLGKGLETAPEMKPMVEFLSEELERQLMGATEMTATPELISLAEQVRTILAAYGPDDPAVAAIKESPAYKQVAWLIDEPIAAPRGLAQ